MLIDIPNDLMMSKKKDDLRDRVVYSTNPDYSPEETKSDAEQVAPPAQTLYISLQRLKGGKVATVVENYQGAADELQELGKRLKHKCGTGGTVKDGVILIQGEQREKVIALLQTEGYRTKRKGG